MTSEYHYTECGLDDVFLANGFTYTDTPSGRAVSIQDIDGLHEAIGEVLVYHKEELNGKELRFLRHEMLMSQGVLAKLLHVTVQTINRWENGKTKIDKTAEAVIRLMYMDHIGGDGHTREKLREIADIEEAIDKADRNILLDNHGGEWRTAA